MAAPTQRRALGALFLVLALALGGVAAGSAIAGRWVIAAAAAALAAWLASLALQGLRPR